MRMQQDKDLAAKQAAKDREPTGGNEPPWAMPWARLPFAWPSKGDSFEIARHESSKTSPNCPKTYASTRKLYLWQDLNSGILSMAEKASSRSES